MEYRRFADCSGERVSPWWRVFSQPFRRSGLVGVLKMDALLHNKATKRYLNTNIIHCILYFLCKTNFKFKKFINKLLLKTSHNDYNLIILFNGSIFEDMPTVCTIWKLEQKSLVRISINYLLPLRRAIISLPRLERVVGV